MDPLNLFYDSRSMCPELWDFSQNRGSLVSPYSHRQDSQDETHKIPEYIHIKRTGEREHLDASNISSTFPLYHTESKEQGFTETQHTQGFSSKHKGILEERSQFPSASTLESSLMRKHPCKWRHGSAKYRGVPKPPAFESISSRTDDLMDVTLSQLLSTQVPQAVDGNESDEGCTPFSPIANLSKKSVCVHGRLSRPSSGIAPGSQAADARRKACGSGFGPEPVTSGNSCGLSPAPLKIPGQDKQFEQLLPVEEIPSKFRSIFNFPYFNLVQSKVFNEVFYTDRSVVVSAPTGSGKTVICELAVIRLLMMATEGLTHQPLPKIVYMAPMKSLCHERFLDWEGKFSAHGLRSLELTGDTELNDLTELQSANIIITTPEKFDSMSRKWKDNTSVFKNIHLFLIDEVHTLNDANRGATVEAVVSRMKTLSLATRRQASREQSLRIVAVSATIPNIDDLAEWLSDDEQKAISVSLGDRYRPVPLQRLVMGYPMKEGSSAFCFDLNLSYRLLSIIDTYSEGKPTLVFCSSRKSVLHTAEILAKGYAIPRSKKPPVRNVVTNAAKIIRDAKISGLLQVGIGVHHAGMAACDRQIIEELFRGGDLPVLISTSTLAMGVNLPAHLVVVKSTMFYNMGFPQEYADTQVLQMIGRAGRPQFDTSATAIILTKASLKSKYEALLNGTQLIESSLHKNLIEHLNAEVVLKTITDLAFAVEWIRHTFLYVRVMKNPRHYGVPLGLDRKQVEKKLEDLCLQNINMLAGLNLVEMDNETTAITPTDSGKLMARYCIAFETMKKFHSVAGGEGEKEMLDHLVGCAEFSDIQLRTTEKKTLNSLNKDKNRITIRYPMNGKVKTAQMKTNCLIQAALGCLPVHDYSLTQDTNKIFRVGQRVTKCLMEFLWEKNMFGELVAAIQLYKSFKTRLWCDSKYVAKQLEGIGPTMSLALVNAGMTSFQKIDEANPRELELIVNRHAPFGNHLKAAVRKLPQYDLSIEQAQACRADSASLLLRLELAGGREQQQQQQEAAAQPALPHQAVLLIGDLDNNVVFKWRVFDSQLQRQGAWCRSVEVKRAVKGPEISIHLISLEWVGIDIHTTYVPIYSGGFLKAKATPKPSVLQDNRRAPSSAKRTAGSMEDDQTKKSAKVGAAGRSCSHRCGDKAACGHKCCKVGTLAGGEEEEEADVGLPSLTYRPRGKQQLQEQQGQQQQQQWQQQQQHGQQQAQQQQQRQHQQQQQHQLQLHRQQLQQLQLKQHIEQQQQLQARVPQPNQDQAQKSQLQSPLHEQSQVQPPKMQQYAFHWRRQGAGSEQRVQDQKNSLPEVSDSQADSSPVIPVQGKAKGEHSAALVPGRDDDWEDLNIFQKGREAGSFSDGDFSSENDWERSQEMLMNNHSRNVNMNSSTAAVQQPQFYSASGWTRDYGFPGHAQPALAGSAKSSGSQTDVEPEPFIRGCSPRKPSNVASGLRSKTEQGNWDAGVEPKRETPSRQGDPRCVGARSALSIQAIVNEVHRTPEVGSLFEGIF